MVIDGDLKAFTPLTAGYTSCHLELQMTKWIKPIPILKGQAQAKIIKKLVILFRVLNMTIWCKHVHRLELQIFIIFVLRTYQLH